MKEIYLSNITTPEKERAALIEKLDDIFKDEQLVMSPYSWANNQCFPIKSIEHFITYSPTHKAKSVDLIVWFNVVDECLTIKNITTGRSFHIRLVRKNYLEDFPYIYEGKLKNPDFYIIPIKFR